MCFSFLTDYTCFSGKTACFLSAKEWQATVIFNLDHSPLPQFMPTCFLLCVSVKRLIKIKSIDSISFILKRKERKKDMRRTASPPRPSLASLPLLRTRELVSSRWIAHAQGSHNTRFLLLPLNFEDLENKQWGQRHRDVMIPVNLALEVIPRPQD